MKFWQTSTAKYFAVISGTFLFCLLIFMLSGSVRYQLTKNSMERYMENLRDMVFMSTYDSLKKGNMKVFKSHMEEIATFGDVQEFSLIDTRGVVHYSSSHDIVKQVDENAIGLTHQKSLQLEDYTSYYFPVMTTSYCSRCHAEWTVGSINSYYKLTLSRRAIDEVEASADRNQGVLALGGLAFVAFLLLVAMNYERRKREEQALLSSSVRNFMDSVDDPFLIVDEKGKCTFCNQAGMQLLGCEDENELIGKDVHKAIQHTREDGSPTPREESLLAKMLEVGKSIIVDEILLWRADGSYFVAECRLHPIIRGSEISGATLTLLDVTKKKAEDVRTMQLSHLASLGELAAGVAHEINNPISGVINYTQLYKNRYETDKEGADLLNRIIKEGTRISSIVYSLLNYAHQGADKTEQVNYVDVISETLNLFQTRLESEGIVLDVSIGEDIPTITGNFQNLEQVLMNLISNSRYALNKKYPDSRNVDKILCIVLERMDDEVWPHIRLTIFDHGVGIPSELINKVMNPFVTTKPAGDGTGLGLHVCFNIIKQHNGRIEIESEPGEFTRVTIELPVDDE